VLYKRFANCSNSDELDDLHAELVDRFGLLPEPAQALLESHRLRLLAKPLGIAKLDASNETINLQFVVNPPIDPARIIELIQTRRHYQLAGPDKLRIKIASASLPARVDNIIKLFKELS
jgi:transcription-repair coupling factor (superfamily II helicase)